MFTKKKNSIRAITPHDLVFFTAPHKLHRRIERGIMRLAIKEAPNEEAIFYTSLDNDGITGTTMQERDAKVVAAFRLNRNSAFSPSSALQEFVC